MSHKGKSMFLLWRIFLTAQEIGPYKVIRTRVNKEIVSFEVQDIAAILGVSLTDGEKYSKEWWSNIDDVDCIWKDQKKPITAEVFNLLK